MYLHVIIGTMKMDINAQSTNCPIHLNKPFMLNIPLSFLSPITHPGEPT